MTSFTRHYLDWNATAPLRPEARSAMLAAMDIVGNPSSVHAEGRLARRIVEDAREKVARLVGAQASEVIFTSGATEANNWVAGRAWDNIIISRLEHPSVIAPVLSNSARVVELPVGANGIVSLSALEEWLSTHQSRLAVDPRRTLLVLQMANNETGVVQPVQEAADLAAAYGISVMTDAVQVAGRLPIDFRHASYTFMTLTSHKLGGPKGIGALIARVDAPLPPLLIGGGQERGRRAGTENVASIAGFGAAAAAAAGEVPYFSALAGLRDRLEMEIARVTPHVVVIGKSAPRLANTSCLSLPGRSAETLIAALDLSGVAVSAGSACSSGKVGPSAVLAAMGLPSDVARGAVRVSIGPATTPEDIDAFITAWTRITRPAVHAA